MVTISLTQLPQLKLPPNSALPTLTTQLMLSALMSISPLPSLMLSRRPPPRTPPPSSEHDLDQTSNLI